MKDWPQNWRPDRGIMERLCECGIGHPDFDDPKSKLPYEGIHGCCGHCGYDRLIDGLPSKWINENYAARSDGTIWSFFNSTPRQLVPRPNGKDYLRVSLDGDKYIHRLMWEIWKGPIPEGQQVRHFDGDKSNNCLWNLRLGTQKDNEADKERHGRVPRGVTHKNSRLTEADVITARAMWKMGKTLKEIKLQLKLTIGRQTLHEAVTGKTWKQLDTVESPFQPGRWPNNKPDLEKDLYDST
jgi:hypothetical protein